MGNVKNNDPSVRPVGASGQPSKTTALGPLSRDNTGMNCGPDMWRAGASGPRRIAKASSGASSDSMLAHRADRRHQPTFIDGDGSPRPATGADCPVMQVAKETDRLSQTVPQMPSPPPPPRSQRSRVQHLGRGRICTLWACSDCHQAIELWPSS